MPCQAKASRGIAALAAIGSAAACTSWTSVRAGHGFPLGSEPAVSGVELSHGRGTSIDGPTGYASVLLDGNDTSLEAAARAGAMLPVQLSGDLSLAPSLQAEMARASRIDGQWYGGALGPGAGVELLWWFLRDETVSEAPPSLGCFGGGVGVDCPSMCRRTDVTRQGLGVRLATEYDIRFGGAPDAAVFWVMVSFTHALSEAERSCCTYYRRPGHRDDCEATR